MPFFRSVCLLVFFLTGLSFARAKPALEVRAPAVETVVRGGLPNVLAKLQTGGEVRIGYLGGSITEQPGWRVKSLHWLQSKYPQAQLSEINATVGGTGSDLGVFRARHDVISKKPDLLFVEFAVNDNAADPALIQRAMEGIVRQTWRDSPQTDICFIYTICAQFLNDLKAGKASRSTTAMEGVAAHYDLPSINLGVDVAAREKAGTLVYRAPKDQPANPAGQMIFSYDGTHPLVETGHELYLQSLVRSFAHFDGAGKPGPHSLVEPLRADNYEQARILPITRDLLGGTWKQLDAEKPGLARDFSHRLPAVWLASEPGATLSFTFTGSLAMLYDFMGPDGGLLEVQIDDKPVKKVPRFDSFCTYHRLYTLNLASSPQATTHRVRITLSALAPDKARILSNKADLAAHPEKYASNVWHLGGILLVGELVR